MPSVGENSVQMATLVQLMHQQSRVTPALNDLLHPHEIVPVHVLTRCEVLESVPGTVDHLRSVLGCSALWRQHDQLDGANELGELLLLQGLVTVLILEIEELLDGEDPNFRKLFILMHAFGPTDLLLVLFGSQAADVVDEIAPEGQEVFELSRCKCVDATLPEHRIEFQVGIDAAFPLKFFSRTTLTLWSTSCRSWSYCFVFATICAPHSRRRLVES